MCAKARCAILNKKGGGTMHEKVAAYLAEQAQKAREADLQAREQRLVELGLWEQEFDPEERGYSAEYPLIEDGRYYRKAAVPVTDGEWAEICACAENPKPTRDRRKNPVGQALRVIGMGIYAVGFLVGAGIYVYSRQYGVYEMALLQLVSTWVTAAVSGTVFLGFSEVIRLLTPGDDEK